MLLGLTIATTSVALGSALSLAPRDTSAAFGWGRRLIVLLAAAFALFDLLPSAFAQLGAWAALALLVPLVLGQLEHRAMGSSSDLGTTTGLTIGFAAILAHAWLDGVVIGIFSEPPIERAQQFGVLIAESVHSIAITAAVCLRWRERAGSQAARTRAIAIAIASTTGVLASSQIPGATHGIDHAATPWIEVIVAGILLHIAAHEFHRSGCEHEALS